MSGWHPEQVDGGIPPNPNDRNNPIQAYPPNWPPQGTVARYYGNGCDVRLRPHVLNSLISENLELIDWAGVNYNPGELTNLRTGVQYIVQKGLPKWVILGGGPIYYTGTLDPPLQRQQYNNGMVLTILPTVKNTTFVRLDVGGGWWVPLLRNDLQELEQGDLEAGVPYLIGYYNGAFYMLGICKSQVPIILKGTIWFYVRPDGNDYTGDGTENTPEKAFRTLDGAWWNVGYRYSASPTSHISFILGIPGDYEGCALGPYGATVSVNGGPQALFEGNTTNWPAYRIHTKDYGIGATYCVCASGINSFILQGVTLVMDNPRFTAYGNFGIADSRSSVTTNNVEIQLAVDHPFASCFLAVRHQAWFAEASDVIGRPASTLRFIGNGRQIEHVMDWQIGSSMTDHNPAVYTPPIWYFENIRSRGPGLIMNEFSTIWNACRMWIQVGCTGPQFSVGQTSNFAGIGRGAPPGNTAGAIGSFSTVT